MIFEIGRRLYHHSNHQIMWVRLSGIIVSVHECVGRTIFTLDDSSGMCIDCTSLTPKPSRFSTNPAVEKVGKNGPTILRPKIPWEDMDVGVVVIIKGGVTTFRDQKQIDIVKVEVLRGTDEEVKFWNNALGFRQNVLSAPWVLTKREENKCMREASGKRSSRSTSNEKTDGGSEKVRHESKVVNDENRNPNPQREDEARKRQREKMDLDTKNEKKTGKEISKSNSYAALVIAARRRRR